MPAIENDEFLKEKENFEKVAAEVKGYTISLERNIGTYIITFSGLMEKFREIFDMIREGRQKYTLEELQETTKKLKAAFDEVKPKSEELVKKREKERKEKKEKEENLEKIKEETISYIESLKIKLKRDPKLLNKLNDNLQQLYNMVDKPIDEVENIDEEYKKIETLLGDLKETVKENLTLLTKIKIKTTSRSMYWESTFCRVTKKNLVKIDLGEINGVHHYLVVPKKIGGNADDMFYKCSVRKSNISKPKLALLKTFAPEAFLKKFVNKNYSKKVDLKYIFKMINKEMKSLSKKTKSFNELKKILKK